LQSIVYTGMFALFKIYATNFRMQTMYNGQFVMKRFNVLKSYKLRYINTCIYYTLLPKYVQHFLDEMWLRIYLPEKNAFLSINKI